MKRGLQQLDHLNIALMLLACVGAFLRPFELFLFSYAVLGPLHYLTEISWLHDRGYFTDFRATGQAGRANRFWLILVAVALAVMLYGVIAEKVLARSATPIWEMGLFYLVFLTAAWLIFVNNEKARIVLVGLTAVALLLSSHTRYYAVIAYFLITIIHVLIFTGAFILYGALKSRSRSGVLSLAVLIACVLCCLLFNPGWSPTVGDYVRNSYSSFQTLNYLLIQLFHGDTRLSLQAIYESGTGLAVMRLIAFAYTYHYLNWFSKTSIIKWHEVPRVRGVVIICLWIASIGLYAYSYETGMIALYCLSVLHVMLEFPLNHRTFAGIGKELRSLLRPQLVAATEH